MLWRCRRCSAAMSLWLPTEWRGRKKKKLDSRPNVPREPLLEELRAPATRGRQRGFLCFLSFILYNWFILQLRFENRQQKKSSSLTLGNFSPAGCCQGCCCHCWEAPCLCESLSQCLLRIKESSAAASPALIGFTPGLNAKMRVWVIPLVVQKPCRVDPQWSSAQVRIEVNECQSSSAKTALIYEMDMIFLCVCVVLS